MLEKIVFDFINLAQLNYYMFSAQDIGRISIFAILFIEIKH